MNINFPVYERTLTMCKFQGGDKWCAVGGFTPEFPCPSDRKSHATRPGNLH